MRKKIVIIFIIVLQLFMSGCIEKKHSNQVTEENKYINNEYR